MHLDTLTLTVAGGFVALLSSVLIAGAWTQIPRAPALLWWAAATFLDAVGIILVAVGGATGTVPALIAGIGFFVASPAFVWAGARIFAGRRVPITILAAGLVVWLALGVAPVPERQLWSMLVGFVAPVVYLSAAIAELLRGRREGYPARWVLVALLGVHIAVIVGGIVDALTGQLVEGALPSLGTWFGVINFESLLYSIASAVFMIVLAKERHEQEYVAASRRDSLTGVANRGALLESGERLLKRCLQEGMSFSLIMFDLDHFKRVNDTYGHAAGDAVLREFAATCLAILRPTDLFGRYGGEEFVVVLPRATIEAAYVIADRIRNAFSIKPIAVGGAEIRCTVSAGVASAGSQAMTLEDNINVADTCLYRAKELGRNRVERPAKAAPEPSGANVIRVA